MGLSSCGTHSLGHRWRPAPTPLQHQESSGWEALAVTFEEKVEWMEERGEPWYEREEWVNEPDWHYEPLCRNQVCSSNWEPVCGCTCDGIYCRTFENECHLRVYNCHNTPDYNYNRNGTCVDCPGWESRRRWNKEVIGRPEWHIWEEKEEWKD